MTLFKRLGAEFLGTFWLVFGGCGNAVLTATFPDLGIGILGVRLAFGLTLVTMIYAFGYVSGGHFNPAVSIGLFAAGRFNGRELIPYIITQVVAGIFAAILLYFLASGKADFSLANGFAANGYGSHSPGGYSIITCLVMEMLMTFVFLMIILGSTNELAPVNFAPLAIGLALTLIHLISIPLTNTSVNPARSTGPALIMGDWALLQLWMFWLAPIVGGLLAGGLYRLFGFNNRTVSTLES